MSLTIPYLSALYMNDTMVVSGSGAGIVKIWDLPTLLQMPVGFISLFVTIIIYFSFQAGSLITPLRKINMKGILHYPVKEIYQCTYTDLVIIAKYEGKKKKDKVKIVEVKWNQLLSFLLYALYIIIIHPPICDLNCEEINFCHN